MIFDLDSEIYPIFSPWKRLQKNSDLVTESPHFNDPYASKRSQIDDQIRHLQQEIQNLQVERNALLPISSIPDDVIAYIFSLCRGQSSSMAAIMEALLPLTWVCRRWRTVALSAASLWVYISMGNLHWAEECLTRSKQAPLEVSLSLYGPHPIDIGILLPHTHRFRRLTVRVGKNTSLCSGKLGVLLTQPAPILESLDVVGSNVPSPMFSGICPLLDTVRLSGENIMRSSNTLLHNLKSIFLDFPGGMPFLTFIESLPPSFPNLESLVFTGTLLPSVDPPSTRRIHLPKLKSLTLFNPSISPIRDLLERCSLVPLTLTKIYIDVKADRGGTAFAFLQLLQASQTLEHHPIASMQLSQGDTASSAFVIGGSDGPLDCTLLHKLPWSAISQVLPSLPLHNVTVLTLTIPELSRNDWANIFVQFVRLEKLMLEEEETAESFVEFIIASTPDNFDDSVDANLGLGHDLPFRSLRRLSLCKGYFELEDDEEVQDDFPAFCSALKLRRGYGLPLEKLWLPHDAFHVYVDSLGEVVEELLFVRSRYMF